MTKAANELERFFCTLREAREFRGLQIAEAAEACGISENVLNRYEQDSSGIPCDVALKLAELYKVSLDEFFFGKEEEFVHRIEKEVRRKIQVITELIRKRGVVSTYKVCMQMMHELITEEENLPPEVERTYRDLVLYVFIRAYARCLIVTHCGVTVAIRAYRNVETKASGIITSCKQCNYGMTVKFEEDNIFLTESRAAVMQDAL